MYKMDLELFQYDISKYQKCVRESDKSNPPSRGAQCLHTTFNCAVISSALGNNGGNVAGQPPCSHIVINLRNETFSCYPFIQPDLLLCLVNTNVPHCFLKSASPNYFCLCLCVSVCGCGCESACVRPSQYVEASHWCSLLCHKIYRHRKINCIN